MNRIDVADFPKVNEEPRGFNVKYWIDAGGKKIVKYNDPSVKDSDVIESLSSLILKYLGLPTTDVILGYNSDQEYLKDNGLSDPNCCIINTFLQKPSEIVINLLNNPWKYHKTADIQKDISIAFYGMFKIFSNLMDINEEDLNKMKIDYIRMVLGDCIIDNEDRRLKNVEAIYDEKSFTYHLAPSFDNALAFNAYNIGSTESYCYIGNQEFPAKEIIKHIINHYYKEVDDIIQNLEYLINSDLEKLLNYYKGEISEEKLTFIYNYITATLDFIKENIPQKTI